MKKRAISKSDKRKIFYNARRIAELVILEEIARINDLAAAGSYPRIEEVKELKMHLHAIRRSIRQRKYPF